MRISKAGGLAIALYGMPCVGKTTIAKSMARILGVDVRHCSQHLRSVAVRKGIPISSLSLRDHREVDLESVSFVQNNRALIVIEGSFLHYVLASTEDTVLIKLVCSRVERLRRWTRRQERRSKSMSLSECESSRKLLEQRLFQSRRPAYPSLTFDTSGNSIQRSAELLLEVLDL